MKKNELKLENKFDGDDVWVGKICKSWFSFYYSYVFIYIEREMCVVIVVLY